LTTLNDFEARTITGQDQRLAEYRGKVVLVVNTASKCGFTPQFAGLEKLYDGLRDEGLVVLGFPCDQFAHQEFDDNAEIADFCQLNYGVTFPMFAKVDVNGKDAHPLFAWLRTEQGGVLGDAIKWNFTKFLVNREGEVVNRYAPTVPPEAIEDDIRALLAEGAECRCPRARSSTPGQSCRRTSNSPDSRAPTCSRSLAGRCPA
jgi:glutathione peroxidase